MSLIVTMWVISALANFGTAFFWMLIWRIDKKLSSLGISILAAGISCVCLGMAILREHA